MLMHIWNKTERFLSPSTFHLLVVLGLLGKPRTS